MKPLHTSSGFHKANSYISKLRTLATENRKNHAGALAESLRQSPKELSIPLKAVARRRSLGSSHAVALGLGPVVVSSLLLQRADPQPTRLNFRVQPNSRSQVPHDLRVVAPRLLGSPRSPQRQQGLT